jgi:HNH endonuclease
MELLSKHYSLVLNALYMPMGSLTIKKALITLNSSEDGISNAALAFDLDYELDDKGNVDFLKPKVLRTVEWDEFITLPLRDFDIPIHSPRMTIRAPIVILSKSKKIVMKKIRPTIQNLYDLYGGKCVWSGKVLSKNSATREHLIPKSQKGDDSFKNVVLADRKINHERGNLPLEKWKYKMQYQPKEPLPRPWVSTIKNAPREEWRYFLFNK